MPAEARCQADGAHRKTCSGHCNPVHLKVSIPILDEGGHNLFFSILCLDIGGHYTWCFVIEPHELYETSKFNMR